MNDVWLKRLLWLLIPAILILIAAVAVVERVTRPAVAVIPMPVTSIPVENVRTGARIGLAAPDFTLPTLGDKEFTLSDYRGKNVVLNFWATWCGPCRYEVPSFKALHDKYGNDSIVVVAVSSLDNPDSVASYAATNDLDFIIPLDPRGIVSTLYNIRGMPTTIFINDKGIITSIKIGPFINLEEIEERLTSFK